MVGRLNRDQRFCARTKARTAAMFKRRRARDVCTRRGARSNYLRATTLQARGFRSEPRRALEITGGSDRTRRLLVLLAVLAPVRGAGFDLAVHAGERRKRFGAFLLVLVLLRLLLFFVAAHLTLRQTSGLSMDHSIAEWRSVAYPHARRYI